MLYIYIICGVFIYKKTDWSRAIQNWAGAPNLPCHVQDGFQGSLLVAHSKEPWKLSQALDGQEICGRCCSGDLRCSRGKYMRNEADVEGLEGSLYNFFAGLKLYWTIGRGCKSFV